MCGIAGFLNRNGEPADRTQLERMLQTLIHRGPDAGGVFIDGSVGLGHRRLSIIDLSGGHQPMQTADRSLTVTFNGEIFNYVELRAELIGKGYQFTTQSDTEVILHLYAEYGEDCVQHMNGQWAFAIWDARRRKLFLSRDRMGIRPLFYTTTAKTFLFASEIKALLSHPQVDRELDWIALDQTFTFWSPLSPRTMFRNIQELPPAHSLTWQNGTICVRRYWQLDYEPDVSLQSEDECAGHLLDLLIDATRLRLRSDVPVGAYLSGGLDSSVTTALIKRFTDAPLSTFSVAFEDPDFDESMYQNEVVHALQTDHQQIRCGYDMIGAVFPDVIWHTEKPVLRTAPAPLYLLSGQVRDAGYKVVMTGEGADEVLGGYDIFKEAKVRRFWARQPDSKYRPLLLKRLYPYMKNLQAQPPAYLKAFFHVRLDEVADPFFSHLPRWDLTSKLKVFLSDDVRNELGAYDAIQELRDQLPVEYSEWNVFCQSQYLETTGLMPGYILSSQGDRMAMAHSVEGRFPFLDHRVVEYAARLSPRMKMKGLDEKHILKRAAKELVPTSVLRRPKQPYRAPDIHSFFRISDGTIRRDYVDELLSFARLQDDGVFNPRSVGKLVAKIRSGQSIGTRDNMALVGILSTQILMERFVSRPDQAASQRNQDVRLATV